jgi:hypothetical protein
MKRAALMTVLALTLAACGGAASPGATTGTTPETATTPATTGNTLPAGSVEAAVAQVLAQQVQAGVDTLQLVSKEPQEWPDGGLGCPDPAAMYTQAIVPGYKLTYSAGGKTYEVHTDESGGQAVLCENGKPTTLGG